MRAWVARGSGAGTVFIGTAKPDQVGYGWFADRGESVSLCYRIWRRLGGFRMAKGDGPYRRDTRLILGKKLSRRIR